MNICFILEWEEIVFEEKYIGILNVNVTPMKTREESYDKVSLRLGQLVCNQKTTTWI